MTLSERLKDILGQGWEASKELAAKAGAKAQDLGGKGVLKIEIMQLAGQAKKWLERLGSETYKMLAEQGAQSIPADDPVIKGILGEITSIRENIEKKERELSPNS